MALTNGPKKPTTPAPPRQRTAEAKKTPAYNVIDRQTGKVVATAVSLKSARRVVDRRDNEYGGYRFFHEKIK